MNVIAIAYAFPVLILGLIIFGFYAGEHADKIPILKELIK